MAHEQRKHEVEEDLSKHCLIEEYMKRVYIPLIKKVEQEKNFVNFRQTVNEYGFFQYF